MSQLSSKGIETFELDVTKTDVIQRIKTKVMELTGGSLDILVNNAYVPYSHPTFRALINVAPIF